MKVNSGSIKPNIGPLENSRSQKPGKSGTESVGPRSKVDLSSASKVSVSGQGLAMQKAKEIASNQDVDEAKIARLQKLIDAGNYKVDSAAVADRLVDEHLLLPDQ